MQLEWIALDKYGFVCHMLQDLEEISRIGARQDVLKGNPLVMPDPMALYSHNMAVRNQTPNTYGAAGSLGCVLVYVSRVFAQSGAFLVFITTGTL